MRTCVALGGCGCIISSVYLRSGFEGLRTDLFAALGVDPGDSVYLPHIAGRKNVSTPPALRARAKAAAAGRAAAATSAAAAAAYGAAAAVSAGDGGGGGDGSARHNGRGAGREGCGGTPLQFPEDGADAFGRAVNFASP